MPPRRRLPSTKRDKPSIKKPTRPSKVQEDEEIDSSDEDQLLEKPSKKSKFHPNQGFSNQDDDFLDLPAEEKRLRVAKKYLEELGVWDDQDTNHKSVEDILPKFQPPLENHDPSYFNISSLNNVGPIELGEIIFKKGHKDSATSIAIPAECRNSPTPAILYSAAKDSSIIRWDLKEDRKIICVERARKIQQGPTKDILSLCCCIDDFTHLICSGGADNVVHVWDCRLLGSQKGLVALLKGHRESITGIQTEPNSEFEQLISTSLDNTVKLWSLRTLSYINTLYGHTGGILSVDITRNNRPLTVSDDGSARLWKIREESHFMFRHPLAPIDACAILNKHYFITGNQEGTLTLWNFINRKPLFTQLKAHNGWITSLTSIPETDIVISGSYDGYVKLWWAHRVEGAQKNASIILTELSDQRIAIEGCISQIKVYGEIKGSRYHGTLYLALGRDHKLGRWLRCSGKPGIIVISFTCYIRINENDTDED